MAVYGAHNEKKTIQKRFLTGSTNSLAFFLSI